MVRDSLCPALISISLLTVLLLPSTAMAGWNYLKTEDGVEVYERNARYMGEQTLRAVVEVDAPIGQVVSVFTDPEARMEWTYRADDQEVLQVDGDTEDQWLERFWTRIDMPFPVSDRDYLVAKKYELHPEERKLTARVRSINDDRKPEQSCCVRALSVMRYTLEAIPGEERTRVELIAETDLRGNLSSGRLVRQNAPAWPVGTLKRLAERAEANGVPIDERVADWHEMTVAPTGHQ